MNAARGGEDGRDDAESRGATAGTERHVTIVNNRVDSRDVFVGTREIVIVHGSDAYHLRLTAQNKLILTK